jgi:hypothetical protein
MTTEISGLIKAINAEVQMMESEESYIYKLATEVVTYLERRFQEVKSLISEYEFVDENEEILFFKKTKPQLFNKMIYYSKILNIENLRPTGSFHAQKRYLLYELDQLTIFFNKNIDFYKYYRSGDIMLDRYYFLRGKQRVQMVIENFYFERDPRFSTSCDFKVTNILANDLLQVYLNEELQKLGQYQVNPPDKMIFPKSKETWTRSKTDLVELIYALCEADCFNYGRITLKRLTDYLENVFNIDLGDVYHTYLTIRGRTNRVQLLDELKEKLIAKMNKDDQK